MDSIDITAAMQGDTNYQQCFTCPIVIAVAIQGHKELESIWGANEILDPAFPVIESLLTPQHGVYGKRFGVPYQSSDNRWQARAQTTLKLLCMYSISDQLLSNPTLILGMDKVIDRLIPCSTPFRLKATIINSAQKTSSMADMFVHGEEEQVTAVPSYHSTSLTTPTIHNRESGHGQ